MTAVLGTRVYKPKYTPAELIGVWFLAGFMFTGFFSLPYQGRMPTLMLALLGCTSILFYTKEQLGRIRLSFPMVALITWAVLSVTWSIVVWRSVLALQLYVVTTAAMICIISVMSLELIIRGLLRGMYGTILLTLASLVIAPGTTLVDSNGYRSVHGWFTHKNVMAPYMVMCVALILAWEVRPRVRFWAIFGAVALIIGSLSATGMIGLMLVLAVDYVARNLREADRPRRATMITSLFALSLVLIVVVSTFLPELVAIYGKDVTLSGRTKIWGSVWEVWRERFLIGWGLDAAFQAPSPLINRFYNEIGFVPAHAHNGILDVGITLGAVGVVFVLWMFFGTWWAAVQLLLKGVGFARSVWVYVTLVLIMSVTESTLLWPNIVLIFIFRIVFLRMRPGGDLEVT